MKRDRDEQKDYWNNWPDEELLELQARQRPSPGKVSSTMRLASLASSGNRHLESTVKLQRKRAPTAVRASSFQDSSWTPVVFRPDIYGAPAQLKPSADRSPDSPYNHQSTPPM